jgi:hypothetical protein
MLEDAEVQEIVEKYAGGTDAPGSIYFVARWFRDSLEATRGTGACAAMEIGTRLGGASAMFCAIADRVADPEFVVLSVDPFGQMPLYSPGLRDNPFGEEYYAEARKLLARFPRSVLFRMAAGDFIASVLPTYRWWREGVEYPGARRFLSFAYLDGQHEETNIVQEAAGLAPFIAPGGVIAIDNTELVPGAVALLGKSPRLGLRNHVHWAGPGGGHERDAFSVP